MNKIIAWLSRKKILIITLLFTLIFLPLYLGVPYSACKNIYELGYCRELRDVFNYVALLLMIFPVILVFSLIIYKLREKIFISWRNFTFYYFLIYLFFVLIVPWDFGDVYIPIYKGTVALFLSVLYFFISIFIIIFSKPKN